MTMATTRLLAAPDVDAEASTAATAAELILGHLADQGVDTIFGIPGGHISPFLGALRRQRRIRYVIARHEGGAAFMADGYARASGRPGVCLVTAGPGVTNALTGVAAAHLDGSPMLLLSGQVPTDSFGRGGIQESTSEGGIDLVAALRYATVHSSLVVDPRAVGRQIGRALAELRRRPGGAVHLCIPANLARAPLDPAEVARWPRWRMTRGSGGHPPEGVVAAVHERLSAARRPLVYLGSGAREALLRRGDAFIEWSQRHGIAVVTSPRAKGLIDERAPCSLGVFGLAGSLQAEEQLRRGCDALLVLGSRLGEWSSNNFSRDLRAAFIAQVDLDEAAIGRCLPVDSPIVADTDEFMAELLALPAASGALAVQRCRELAALKAEVPRQRPTSAPSRPRGRLAPQQVMAALDRRIGEDLDLYVDMGNCTGWAIHCLTMAPPARLFTPCGLSTMGWSCGAVLGGKIATPQRRALALLGDGSFLMNGAEVSTAAKYRIGAVYLVLDDDALGMVNHGEHIQTGHSLDDGYYDLGAPDLVAFARALGAHAYAVDSPQAAADALDAAFVAADAERRPQVIVARINRQEVPPYGERFRAVGGR